MDVRLYGNRRVHDLSIAQIPSARVWWAMRRSGRRLRRRSRYDWPVHDGSWSRI